MTKKPNLEQPEANPAEAVPDWAAAAAEARTGGAPGVVTARSQRDAWYARAKRVMPYGVSSNFRYWGDSETPIIARGKGSAVWDADGRRYIDYRLGFGPILLGHAFEPINAAVSKAMADGSVFAATHIYEIAAAERFTRMTGADMVRWTNSGAESTMHALRVARAHTNRERFIKFEGCYHGAHDSVMWSTPSSPAGAMGSRKSPLPIASSSGIPRVLAEKVITLPYNDAELFERAMRDHGHDVAAVLVEPMMGNNGALQPAPGWLALIREQCNQFGSVMIFDEVKTGFRVAPGGAQQLFGIRADLATYAKSMANGFPIGAIAGKREFMMTIEPGAVGQGGTYCGNIPAVAACDATLAFIEANRVHEQINARGRRLQDGIGDILNRRGIPHLICGVPAMFGVLPGVEASERHDFRSISRQTDDDLSRAICAGLHARGVMPDPDCGEPWFLSYSHSNADIDRTLEAYDEVISTID
jgi:glutamate-1-semialdehyde 2,1-aminomutase